MINKFCVGDLIICIDWWNTTISLKKGEIYKVTRTLDNHVGLEGKGLNLYPISSFKKLDTPAAKVLF